MWGGLVVHASATSWVSLKLTCHSKHREYFHEQDRPPSQGVGGESDSKQDCVNSCECHDINERADEWTVSGCCWVFTRRWLGSGWHGGSRI